MKNYWIIGLVMILLVSMAGCVEKAPAAPEEKNQTTQQTEVAETIEDYILRENGKVYLLLPVSGKKLTIYNQEQEESLQKIDLAVFKGAEARLEEKVAQYKGHSGIYFQADDGIPCLYVEVIVQIDPPVPSEFGESGCGIDHEHKFFKEELVGESK